MTLHVVYDHACEHCGAFYIPYDREVPCPNCGAVEEERFDYIPQAVQSLRFNKRRGGTYMPPAWWVGSLGDHILRLLFSLFDAYESREANEGFAEFAASYLADMNWGDQGYLEKHVLAIAIRIQPELDRPDQPEDSRTIWG